MKYKIPLSRPHLSKGEVDEVNKCLTSSWISSQSPWVTRFEKAYARDISHTKYAASVNSGTSALFLALKALGIGKGDEVILPTFTMIATINAVVWAGATPVIIDCISKNDWNMNREQIEQHITPRTKAIMPVHIYGYVCDMRTIMSIAKKHKLHVIEDAAEAMGSEYEGKRAGSFSTISCFSLYANKIMTTGNGGMACTNDKKLYKLMKKLAFFDFNEKTHFKHLFFGYNLVLSGIQSAIGCAQVKKFSALLKKRRVVYEWYKKHCPTKKVFLMPTPQDQKPNYWFPAMIFENIKDKTKAVKALEKKGIETRDFFVPIHRQPMYKSIFNKKPYPFADYFWKHGLLLPSFHEITENQIALICKIIASTLSSI